MSLILDPDATAAASTPLFMRDEDLYHAKEEFQLDSEMNVTAITTTEIQDANSTGRNIDAKIFLRDFVLFSWTGPFDLSEILNIGVRYYEQ